MNRLYLIAGVIILITAMVFLSQGIKKASPTDEDLQQQAQQDAQKKAATKQAQPTKPSLDAATLPDEETVGTPATAQHHIQVGWVYDEADQKSPAILIGPLGVIRDYVNKSGGVNSAEIVNLDIPTEDRSPAAQTVTNLGVFVDGKPALPGNFSEMQVHVQDITKALDTATGRK